MKKFDLDFVHWLLLFMIIIIIAMASYESIKFKELQNELIKREIMFRSKDGELLFEYMFAEVGEEMEKTDLEKHRLLGVNYHFKKE